LTSRKDLPIQAEKCGASPRAAQPRNEVRKDPSVSQSHVDESTQHTPIYCAKNNPNGVHHTSELCRNPIGVGLLLLACLPSSHSPNSRPAYAFKSLTPREGPTSRVLDEHTAISYFLALMSPRPRCCPDPRKRQAVVVLLLPAALSPPA
jgi:hypothetical protein